MKSKTKSNTRKKNYKRKNNTRKFRQSAGGVKLDSITYPVGRYVFIKQTGFGDDNKWMPGRVFETHLPTDKGPAQLKIQELLIKKGKVLESKKGGPRLLFPDVEKKGPKIINNSNEIRVMTPKEIDELGILDLIEYDKDLRINGVYDYKIKKLTGDMQKASDESEKAFQKASTALDDVDKKRKADLQKRTQNTGIKADKDGYYRDALGRKRKMPQPQNKLSTSSSQGKIETEEKKEIARSSSDPNISKSSSELDTSKFNLSKTEENMNKINELLKDDVVKNNPELYNTLIKLLEQLNNEENDINDIEKQLNQALVIYEEKKPKSFLLGAEIPSALDQIEAANEATNSAVTGVGATEAAKEVTEAVTEGLDKGQLTSDVRRIAPDVEEPPVQLGLDGKPKYTRSVRKIPKVRNNSSRKVVPGTGSDTTGPVPVPPPGASIQVAPEPVPVLQTDDKPGEPEQEGVVEEEGYKVTEPNRLRGLSKSVENAWKIAQRRKEEEDTGKVAWRPDLKQKSDAKKQEHEDNLAKLAKKHQYIKEIAERIYNLSEIDKRKVKLRNKIWSIVISDIEKANLDDEKLNDILKNNETLDLDELNNYLKELPQPPTETEREPVSPPQPPTAEEEGSDGEIHELYPEQPKNFNSSDLFTDDEASPEPSDDEVGFDHPEAQKILDDPEEERKKLEKIQKILAGPQITHEEFEKEMEELEKELNERLTPEEKEALEKEVAQKIEEDKEIEAMQKELGLASSDDDSQSSGPTEQDMEDEKKKQEVKLEEEIKEKEEWIKKVKGILKTQENDLKNLEVTDEKIEEINNSQGTDEDKDIVKKQAIYDHKDKIMSVRSSEKDIAITEFTLAKKKIELAQLKEEGTDELQEEKEKAEKNDKEKGEKYSEALRDKDKAQQDLENAMQQKKEREENKENNENANLEYADAESKEIEDAEKTKTECDKLKNGLTNEDIQVISDKGAEWYKEKIPQYSLLEIKENGTAVSDYGIYIDCKALEFVYYSLKEIYSLQLEGVIKRITNINNNIRLMTKEDKIDKSVLYNNDVEKLYEFLERDDVKDVQNLIENDYSDCGEKSPYTEKFDELIKAVIDSDEGGLHVTNIDKTSDYLKNLNPGEVRTNCEEYISNFKDFYNDENLKKKIDEQINKLRADINKSIKEKRTITGLKKGEVYGKEVYYLKDNNNILDLHIGKMNRKIVKVKVKKTLRISGSDEKDVEKKQDFFTDGNIEENINIGDDNIIKNLYPNTLLLAGENKNFSFEVIKDIINFLSSEKINLHGDIEEKIEILEKLQIINQCMRKVLEIHNNITCRMLTKEAQNEKYYKMIVRRKDKEEVGTLITYKDTEEKTKYGLFIDCNDDSTSVDVINIDIDNFINSEKLVPMPPANSKPLNSNPRSKIISEHSGNFVQLSQIELIDKNNENFDIRVLFKKYLNIPALNRAYNNLNENNKKEYVGKLEKVLNKNMPDFIKLYENEQKIMTDLKHEEKLKSMSLMPENYGKPEGMDMEEYIDKINKGGHEYILNEAEPSIYMYYNNMLVSIANYHNKQDDNTLKNIKEYSKKLKSDPLIKDKIDIPGRLIDAIEAIKKVNNIDDKYRETVDIVFNKEPNDDEYKTAVTELAKILNPGEDEIHFSPIMLPLNKGSSEE